MSSPKIKIIHLVPRLAISGGIENYIRNLCSVPPKDNFQIKIITFFYDNDKSIVREFIKNGYEVNNLKKSIFEILSNKYLKFFFKNSGLAHYWKLIDLGKKLKAINPDKVYVHGEDSELIAGFLNNDFNITNVIHGESYFPLNPFFRFLLLNFLRKKYHSTILVNDKLAKEFKQRNKNKFVVKPGIEIAKFHPSSQKKEVQNQKIILGFLGRLTKEKGVYTLINAFNLVHQKYPEVYLTIGGDGKEFEKIQKLIVNLGLSRKVELKGEVINTKEFYNQLDLFILPSKSEGLPFTILESLASGVPVISSNVGGICEVVTNNFNGILINEINPEKFANAIMDFIMNPDKLQLLKSNCVGSVSDFNIDNFVNKFYSNLDS